MIREIEPLPTFSICSEPPFDNDYMKSELNISPNLFLYTSFLNDLDTGLGDTFPFPTNLSEDYDSVNSLENYWTNSILKPVIFSINGDIVLK